MAQVVELTYLPDKTTKLIEEFMAWLSIINIKDLREWDKRGDGIYICIHSKCEEKI